MFFPTKADRVLSPISALSDVSPGRSELTLNRVLKPSLVLDYVYEFNLTHPHIEYSVTPLRPVSIISVYSSDDVRESMGVPPTTS